MKIRNGFVSNSSSSSFIVTFPNKPETKEELAEMMGECSSLSYDRRGSIEDVINVVWRDIQNKSNYVSILDIDDLTDTYEIKDKISYLIDEVYTELDYWDLNNHNITEKQVLQKIVDKLNNIIKKFDEINDKKFTVKLSYSDEDGEGWLEHGEIFRNLPHEQISHH